MKNILIILFVCISFSVFSQATQPRASQIKNTPAGGVSATNVQTAINELDTEKANLISPSFTTPSLGTATVTDDPYDATGWNGSTQVPTKNALRDKIETLTGVSGLTTNRTPYASSGTALADHANYIVHRSSAIQGNNGFSIMGQVVIGGTYNIHKNQDYSTTGKHSYGLEVIQNETPFTSDSLASGQLAITGYGSPGGNSLHFRTARGTEASPTKILTGDRILGIGTRAWTDLAQFSTSTIGILAFAEEDFTDQSHLGSSLQFETTPIGVSGRVVALRLTDAGAGVFLNDVLVGDDMLVVDNMTIGAAAGANVSGLTLGTAATNVGNIKAYGAIDAQHNDLALGSESATNLRGNNTDRIGVLKFSQRAANATTFFAGIQGNSNTSNNSLQYGGGATGLNAATYHLFYTATNTTTVGGTERFRIAANGNLSNTVADGTAQFHFKAGGTAASSAPIKFTSGSLMTTAEVGAHEFLTDKYYGTITTGAARKEFTLNDAALTSGTTPVATTNGRLTDGLILASSTYTPTLTNSANLDASTARLATYMRVGNTVTVAGQIDIDPSSTLTLTTLGISLPIASAMTTAFQAGGTAAHSTVADNAAAIFSDATNDRVTLQYTCVDVSNHTITYTFTYQVL